MWKEYSLSYMKNNRASSISIMVAALISSLFLSLICGIFYNMWIDNISRIISEEGDWQGRLIGDISEEEIKTIESFSNVKEVSLSESETVDGKVVTVYFYHMKSIYEDLPGIAGRIGLDSSSIQYHNMLLSEYFIFSPEEKENPPMLLAFYLFVMVIVCVSLILIIRNAFAVSMNARLHQLGILQSVGATPGQIRFCLIQEAFALCFLPIFIGILAGTGLCFGFMEFMSATVVDLVREEKAVFHYHPMVFFAALLSSLLTVLFSAWMPARKLSKLSPLQAIQGGEEQYTKKVKSFRIISVMFGVEGELTRKALYVRRKAFRTSSLSLTLSFLAFSIFLCFMTLSDISTQYTYFERYKDTWDLMVTVQDMDNHDREVLSEIRKMPEISNCIAYQKASAYTWLPEDMLSSELKKLGSLEKVAGTDTAKENGNYLVKVPVIILDDESFLEYCNRAGINSSLISEPGTVTVNTIWDNVHSNFRYKQYIPFIQAEGKRSFDLFSDIESPQDCVQVNTLAYTDQAPVLREEYANYSLVQIMSENNYPKIMSQISSEEDEVYFNILIGSDEEMQDARNRIEQLLDGKYGYTLENRLEKEISNAAIINGYNLLVGSLCGLLACIGFANVFSITLGYIHQRKREFARYLSVGLTPQGVKKILFMEALIIGGRPILFSLPLTVLFVAFAVNASYLNPMEFIERMPIIPLLIFAILILASVGLAYYISGRKICRCNIVEALKDDTMY